MSASLRAETSEFSDDTSVELIAAHFPCAIATTLADIETNILVGAPVLVDIEQHFCLILLFHIDAPISTIDRQDLEHVVKVLHAINGVEFVKGR